MKGQRKIIGEDHVLQDFEEYAHIYWATHMSTLRHVQQQEPDHKQLVAKISAFFDKREDVYWIRGVRRMLSQRPVGFYGARVELELEQCMPSHSGAWLLVAAVYGFTELVKLRLEEEGWPTRDIPDGWWTKFGLVNENGCSALHLAARFVHIPLINLLAGIRSLPAPFLQLDGEKKFVIQHALENVRGPLTEAELEAWTRLYGNLHEAWTRVRGDTVPLDTFASATISSAMQNPFCAKALVDLMVDLAPDITPSDELLKAAVLYRHCSVELLTTLSGPNPSPTERILEAAASCCDGVPELSTARSAIWGHLVPEGQEQRLVTDRVVMAAIEAGNAELTRRLLGASRIPASSEMMELAVAHPRHALELVRELLDGVEELETAESILEAALSNPEVGIGLLDLLPNLRGAITEPMLLAMAGNLARGGEMLRWVRTRLPEADLQFEKPAAVVREALSLLNVRFLEELPPLGHQTLPDSFRHGVQEALLWALHKPLEDSRKDDGLTPYPTTAPWLSSSEHHLDSRLAEAMKLLLNYLTGGPVDILAELEWSDLAEYHGPAVMGFILGAVSQLYPGALQASMPKMLLAAARNKTHGYDIFVLSARSYGCNIKGLSYEHPEIVAEAVERGTGRLLELILRRNPQALELVENTRLRNAVFNPDTRVTQIVFGKLGVSNDDLLKAATASDAALECLRSMPGGWWTSLELLEAIVAGCKRTRTLRLALEESGIKLGQGGRADGALALAAAFNRHGIEMLGFVLARCAQLNRDRAGLEVSSRMLSQAAENPRAAPEMLRVLLNQCSDEDLDKLITREVLKSAAANKTEGAGALRVLLMEGKVAERIDEALVAAAATEEARELLLSSMPGCRN